MACLNLKGYARKKTLYTSPVSYVFLPSASANDCSQSQDIGLDVQLTIAILLIACF